MADDFGRADDLLGSLIDLDVVLSETHINAAETCETRKNEQQLQ